MDENAVDALHLSERMNTTDSMGINSLQTSGPILLP